MVRGPGWMCVLVVVWGACCGVCASALGLSEDRVYEVISPVYKGGYGTNKILAVAPGGESVVFASLGVFAGAPSAGASGTYVASRGASGWSTASLLPPASQVPSGFVEGFSTDLESTLFSGELGQNHGAAADAGTEKEFLMHRTGTADTEANWEVAGMVMKTLENRRFLIPRVYASANLCNFVFETAPPKPSESAALLPSAVKTLEQLYDLTVCGEGAPSLRLIAVKNGSGPEPEVIDPYCPVLLGAPNTGRTSTFNALAADGQAIFFTTNANTSLHNENECEGTYGSPKNVPANRAILYVRLGGEKTLRISAPIAADCAVSAPCHTAAQEGAEFQGASENGSRVLFTTTQPLVTEDTQETNNLYVAKLGCPGGEGEACEPAQREVSSLVQVSQDVHGGEAAQVQGVVAISPDASHVYFVARGVLSGEPNAEGQTPVVGADNLYVSKRDAAYPEGRTAFIGDLCSGRGHSGEVEDSSCPLAEGGASDAGLWSSMQPEAQTAGTDGGFLLFSSYAKLVSSDTDTARDVYLYDAQTGALDRVSSGEGGHDANGNNGEFDATVSRVFTNGREFEQARMNTRAISEDGTRVVFTTSEPLSKNAINGLTNAYEWHKQPGEAGEGNVSLISTGGSTEPVENVVISPSGRDVFFITAQGLVPQDTDGVPDIYDARIGGGFPPAESEREQCSGEACYGSLTNPAPLLVPGSVPQAAGENVAPADKKATTTKTAKKKKGKRHKASAGKARKHSATHAASGGRRGWIAGRGRGR